MNNRIFFTGASGKAGKHVASHLATKGMKVLNADLYNYKQPNIDYLNIDITDAAQVFSSMSAHMNVDELRENAEPLKYDTVVHFAAIPRILMASDIETYKVNVMGTYHVLEAAIKLSLIHI